MRRSRSANNLLPLDPEIERTLHRLRKEVDSRTRTERELDIVVQPQPIEMEGNEERAVIEAARPSLAIMTQAIVKPDIIGHFELKQYMVQLIQSTGLFVGLPNEDPQRLTLFPFSLIGEAKDWLDKEPANSIRTWDDLARQFLIKFFPTKKTKILRSQILGFEQRVGETLRQAWERYKKMLRDCPHHFQTDEVLGHTFVDGLDDASKMNLDSTCGGDGDSRKAVKQKSAGLLELDEVSAMRVDIAKMANQMTRMTTQNLERQIGQLATNKNTRPTDALPSDTEKNPQVNAVTLRNGRELEKVPKKKKDKPIPEGELIPKVTTEPKNAAEIPELVEAPRPPPPFPQRLQKKNDDRMFTKFLSMLIQVQLNIPLVDVLHEIPKYAKYIKDIVAHKRRLTEFETVAHTVTTQTEGP
ncbi:uncharacterized protein [Nicotiana sylvestris]|uniref:uncharacterized protein n=1 Tax=Nicotiana sylvestris TaxID=4096 RepID=UPI00388C3999